MHWGIEERALNAWPAQGSLIYDGWVLRFSGGYTRRANSVNALYAGHAPVAEKVAWCEEQYAAQHLPTVFKLCPFSQPETLEQLLDARGYRREAETAVLYAPLSTLLSAAKDSSESVILAREPWFDGYVRISRQPDAARACHQAILSAIVPAMCPVLIQEAGSPVAAGLGVLERGVVGIFDLLTDERYRRKGYASRIMSTILRWAADRGAHGAYLQVMSDNLPALALYTKWGFAHCYPYWYRVSIS